MKLLDVWQVHAPVVYTVISKQIPLEVATISQSQIASRTLTVPDRIDFKSYMKLSSYVRVIGLGFVEWCSLNLT